MKGHTKASRILLAVILMLAAGGYPCVADIVLLYMAQAGYQPPAILDRAAEFTRRTGKPVRVVFSEYEGMYGRIVESAGKEKADYDVILVDLIWTADFVRRGIFAPLPQPLADRIQTSCVPEVYTAFMYDGKLRSCPFLANMQLMYLNMDILARAGWNRPPRTLEELVACAARVRSLKLLKHPVFLSLRKQEALVCEFTWLTGAFGGDLTDADGSIKVDSPEAIAALSWLVDLVARGIINPYSLESDELSAADVFLNGDAAISANWTYVTGEMHQPPYSSIPGLTAALLPVSREVLDAGKVRTSTVSGFQGLSVPANSVRKADAWAFTQFLCAPEFQRRHLNEMSVWKQVWDEPRTRRLDPDIDLKKQQIAGVHNRFQNPGYRTISGVLQTALADALAGRVQPAAALHDAQKRIEALE